MSSAQEVAQSVASPVFAELHQTKETSASCVSGGAHGECPSFDADYIFTPLQKHHIMARNNYLTLAFALQNLIHVAVSSRTPLSPAWMCLLVVMWFTILISRPAAFIDHDKTITNIETQ